MQEPYSRRCFLQAAASGVAGLALPAFAQSDWPARPVRVVTHSAAGDPNDLVVRRFAQAVSTELGQNLVIENTPGAGGVLAHREFLRTPADGYSILHANVAVTLLPSTHPKLPYNPLAEFAPVAFMGWNALGLAIPANHPAKTYAEWAAWARTQKGKLNFGSGGNGSVQHLYGWQLSDHLGLDATHISYRGTGPAIRDMVGGQTHFVLSDTFSLRSFASGGQLRILAVTGPERSRYLPDVPTLGEFGAPNFEKRGWNAWFFKTGTPQAAVDRLASVANRVNALPEWAALREQLWIDWRPLTPAEVAAQVRRETESWAQVVKKSGYVPE